MGKIVTYTCDHCGEAIPGGEPDAVIACWHDSVYNNGLWPIVAKKCLREWLARWVSVPENFGPPRRKP